jgi:hypothetical protein
LHRYLVSFFDVDLANLTIIAITAIAATHNQALLMPDCGHGFWHFSPNYKP